jgi:hypothetical protein
VDRRWASEHVKQLLKIKKTLPLFFSRATRKTFHKKAAQRNPYPMTMTIIPAPKLENTGTAMDNVPLDEEEQTSNHEEEEAKTKKTNETEAEPDIPVPVIVSELLTTENVSVPTPAAISSLSSSSRGFYCPITNNIFQDPVVIPDGTSYERSAITSRGDVPAIKLYSNRALKSIIDDTLEQQNNPLAAGIRRLDQSFRSNITRLVRNDDEAQAAEEAVDPLPEGFYCPITYDLINEPKIDIEGNTYESIAVLNWIRFNGNSPITRTPMTCEDLYDNLAVANLLADEKARDEHSIHPAIRKWKIEQEALAERRRNNPDDPESLTAWGGMDGFGGADLSSYPTTLEHLEERRRQALQQQPNRQRRSPLVTCGVILCAIVILLFIPYGQVIFFALFVAFVCFCRRDPHLTNGPL